MAVLFETIYGKEVEQVFNYLKQGGMNFPKEKLYEAFIPKNKEGRLENVNNLAKSISFLRSAGLIEDKNIITLKELPYDSFKLSLLHSLRNIELGKVRSDNKKDQYFLKLITKLFIEKNRRFLTREDLHTFANDLESDISINTTVLSNWKAFMEYLGIGFRDRKGGFYCTFNNDLIISIINEWGKQEGAIQSFFENHFSNFLPWTDSSGYMSKLIEAKLLNMQNSFHIRLETKQDLAAIAYFPQKYKWMVFLHWE